MHRIIQSVSYNLTATVRSEHKLPLEFLLFYKMQNGDGETNNFFESFSEIDLGSDISGDLSGQELWIQDNVKPLQLNSYTNKEVLSSGSFD